MNRKLYAFFALPFAIALGCSSTATNDEDLSSTEDELRAAAACQGKTCGDPCRLCPPGAKNCFETAVLKECNAQGKCRAGNAVCGGSSSGGSSGGAIDAGPAPYQPCAGKTCGDSCTICPPGDPTCAETAVLKFCHSDGACSASPPACIPPPPPPPKYTPCGGKSCGDLCTICEPGVPGCFETAVIKMCDSAGSCSPTMPVCGAKDAGPAPYLPCAGKACGASCTICEPGVPGCFETAVLKQCNAAGACSPSVPVCN